MDWLQEPLWSLDLGPDACPGPRGAPISLTIHIIALSASGITGTTAHRQG